MERKRIYIFESDGIAKTEVNKDKRIYYKCEYWIYPNTYTSSFSKNGILGI